MDLNYSLGNEGVAWANEKKDQLNWRHKLWEISELRSEGRWEINNPLDQ